MTSRRRRLFWGAFPPILESRVALAVARSKLSEEIRAVEARRQVLTQKIQEETSTTEETAEEMDLGQRESTLRDRLRALGKRAFPEGAHVSTAVLKIVMVAVLGALLVSPAAWSIGRFAHVFLAGTILLWGVSLYELRQDFRRIFGGVELAVAFFFAHSAAESILRESGERSALQGAGAIYLTVRALDNLVTGHRMASERVAAALKQAGENKIDIETL